MTDGPYRGHCLSNPEVPLAKVMKEIRNEARAKNREIAIKSTISGYNLVVEEITLKAKEGETYILYSHLKWKYSYLKKPLCEETLNNLLIKDGFTLRKDYGKIMEPVVLW